MYAWISWSLRKAGYSLEHSAERNRVTCSHGDLLAPRFRLRQDGEHTGERAARCDPPVFAAPGGKMSSLQVASAAFIFVHHMLSSRRKRRERRWWPTELYRKRAVYGGTGLLADLKFQEFSGRYRKFTRKAPTRFELLMNLVGQKIVNRDTTSRAATPVQEKLGHRRPVHPSAISFPHF
jgi:hypothetical protein